MPIVTVNVSDAALASSAPGTFAKSAGPGKATYAAITTPDVAGLPDALTAKADDSSVVKLVGDQAIGGTKTLNDVLVFDMAANSSWDNLKIEPAIVSGAVDDVIWCEGISSAPNGDGSYNHVRTQGWNTAGNSAPLDPTKVSIHDGTEWRWWNAPNANHQAEQHWFALTDPARPTWSLRTMTASCNLDNWTSGITYQASQIGILDESGTQLYQMLWDGSGSLNNTYTINGSTGYALNLLPTGDSLAIGRGTVSTGLTVKGKTAAINLIGDTAQWAWLLQSGQRNPELTLNGVGAVASFLGTTGNIGVVSLTAPAGQSNGTGFQYFTGVGKSGYVRMNSGGSMLIVPDSVGNVYIGGSFTNYLTPANNLFIGGNITSGGSVSAQSLKVGGGAVVNKILSATATLDFPSIAAGATTALTMTLTGAVTGPGSSLDLGPPAALESGLVWCGKISATDTVAITLFNATASAIDPASAVWRATVRTF